MYDDFVKICTPIQKINPEYTFEVKEAEPRKQPKTPGGTDASVFAIEGVPTIGFMEKDFKGYNFSYDEIWHTERDLYTKSIPEYQKHAATVMAIVSSFFRLPFTHAVAPSKPNSSPAKAQNNIVRLGLAPEMAIRRAAP